MSRGSGLIAERDHGVLVLSLARPGRRNVLSLDLRAALERELQDLPRRGLRVVLVRSEPLPDRAVFAAGADLADIGRLRPHEAPGFAEDGQRLFRMLEDADAIVLAAVDGPCHGGALDLALACDVVIASPRARFAHPGARLGIVTGWGGTRRLPRAVGKRRAAALLATGRVLGAEEARESGLVREVVPEAGFDGRCRQRARAWESVLRDVPRGDVGRLKAVLACSPPARRALDAARARLDAAARGPARRGRSPGRSSPARGEPPHQ